MKKAKILNLKDIILTRLGLILYEDLYRVLHFDITKSPRTFELLLNRVLHEYDQYFPVRLCYQVSDPIREIEITSNFDAYLLNTVPEKFIQLVPTTVSHIKTPGFLNSGYWIFDKNTRLIQSKISLQGAIITYFAEHPKVINYAPDGDFDDESYIYFIDEQDERFLTFLEYYIATHVRDINNSIDIGLPIIMLRGLETKVSESEQKRIEFIETRSDPSILWRK